jgi:hypothetical protein
VACHKSPEWSYEREWRTVALYGRDFFEIEPASVILGARIDDLPDQKAALLAIANDLEIPIKQPMLRQDRFELTCLRAPNGRARVTILEETRARRAYAPNQVSEKLSSPQ